MANTYAANFGDVVKHIVLCEALARARPVRYFESHGGRLTYELADLEPGPGGVWDFIELAGGFDSLSSSSYARILRDVAGGPEHPGRYPGSIAFADALLPAVCEVVAFELVESSALNLVEGLVARGRSAQVQVEDGLSGVCELAGPGDFVLLDPFHVQERGEKYTAVEAFVDLAARGCTTLLWYAVYQPFESTSWVTEALRKLDAVVWNVRLVGDTAVGGLAGCGFLGAYLSPEVVASANVVVRDLAAALRGVRAGLRIE